MTKQPGDPEQLLTVALGKPEGDGVRFGAVLGYVVIEVTEGGETKQATYHARTGAEVLEDLAKAIDDAIEQARRRGTL
jgi:hypothetical protein